MSTLIEFLNAFLNKLFLQIVPFAAISSLITIYYSIFFCRIISQNSQNYKRKRMREFMFLREMLESHGLRRLRLSTGPLYVDLDADNTARRRDSRELWWKKIFLFRICFFLFYEYTSSTFIYKLQNPSQQNNQSTLAFFLGNLRCQ